MIGFGTHSGTQALLAASWQPWECSQWGGAAMNSAAMALGARTRADDPLGTGRAAGDPCRSPLPTPVARRARPERPTARAATGPSAVSLAVERAPAALP